MGHDLLSLRPYQREAIDATQNAWSTGMRRPAVVLPTGSGKTIIMSHLIAEDAAETGQRAMVLVNRDELCDQTIDKLHDVAPHLSAGKVKAGDDDVDADIVVASVQTLSRDSRLARMLESHDRRPVGMVLVDEVHYAAANSYRKVMGAFPDARFLGVTATLARGDGVGLGKVVDDVVYSKSILWMISNGYLVDVRSLAIETDLDLSQVKRTGGDYQAGALGAAMMEVGVPLQVVRAMQEHAADRRSLVFTPTVDTAHATAKELRDSGIPAGVVSGTTPREERLRIYSDFAAGHLRAMVNCQVLTTGFDMPQVDCVVIARPTQSQPLFIQMAGRGLRLFPGKKDCLLLNVAGGGGKISTLVDLSDGYVKSVRKGESLEEAALREEKEANLPVTAGSIAFAIKHREMDLFSGSSQNWLRTQKGVLFIPAGDTIVMLWPNGQPGLWDVAAVPKRGKWQKLREGLPLGTAQAWAEMCAEDYADFGTHRTASWRRGRPSQAQMDYATALGMPDLPGLTRGGVGDYISVALASRLIDRFVTTEGVMC